MQEEKLSPHVCVGVVLWYHKNKALMLQCIFTEKEEFVLSCFVSSLHLICKTCFSVFQTVLTLSSTSQQSWKYHSHIEYITL